MKSEPTRTPFAVLGRGSAGGTIAMRWQRRLKSKALKTKLYFLKLETRKAAVLHIFCEHLSPGDESVCHPRPKYLRQAERNPFNAGATICRKQG